MIASGGFDKLIKIWDISDAKNRKLTKTLSGHYSAVLDVKFSFDGK